MAQLQEIIARKKDAERWNELVREQAEVERSITSCKGPRCCPED